jgi:uncharacterized protein involved in exopolysaccharide biosynthesis
MDPAFEEFEHEKSLADYLAILRRRWKVGCATFAGIFVVAALVALLWPPTYRSQGTILIEQQEIPQDLVRTTITSFADQRIELISQRVMTTTNLLGIIRDHGLYAEDFDTEPREVIIERMRADITRDMISADVVDPRSGRPTAATIAFTVGFDSRSPQLAARVANALTSLYLQENSQTRREQAAEASSFMSDEAARLSEEIAMLEAQLAEFKQENVNQLPELAQLNMQLYERTESEINEIRRQQDVLDERRVYLESELAQLNPNRVFIDSNGDAVLSPRERLRALQAQLAGMEGVYSDRHPRVIRTRSAIAALETSLGITASEAPAAMREEMLRLLGERDELQQRYTAQHPEVARLDAQIASLQARIDTAATASDEPADNPAYVQLRAQLEAAELEVSALVQREATARARLIELEQRLRQTPIIERDYTAMTRDLDSARMRYQEIRFGERSAQTAENLELDAKGERFTLIEPPLVPQQPVSPNRAIVVFLGLMLAAGAAIAVIALREVLDRSVHSPDELAAIAAAAPLGVIPRIITDAERRRARRLFTLAAVSGCVAAVLVLGVVHFFVMPLDEFWFRAWRRIGI